MDDSRRWLEKRKYTPEMMQLARLILEKVQAGVPVLDAIRSHPLSGGGHVPKHALVHLYRKMVKQGVWDEDTQFLSRFRMKPVRTLSGVTTVTVLTKPYPCPGNCIFCPTEICEPKSYLSDEPGARRALQNHFDPFLQVTTRLQALTAVGHPVDKIELLVLGGTFSAYPRKYQHWFISRCYEALNQSQIPELPGLDEDVEAGKTTPPADPPSGYDVTSGILEEFHKANESSLHRNVGLVLETRPDEITYEELAWMRNLGATKLQLGAQSLNDEILKINRRGHTTEQTIRAMNRGRAAGYKLVLHWMPNLLGATPEGDAEDFRKLWSDVNNKGGLCPDEIKIYPTQLLKNAELYNYWQRGEYRPYTEEELIHLLADVKARVPQYCRVNRVIRDIPSTNVVAGNKRTSLRQDAILEMTSRGIACQCIRCREVRQERIDASQLALRDIVYQPDYLAGEAATEEHFISYVTPNDKIAGYLRLSLPVHVEGERDSNLNDLRESAIIREIHVYGQSLQVGTEQSGAAQHIGLGTSLIKEAERITRSAGINRLSVISAIGTRIYYRGRGFLDGNLYQWKSLN